MPELSAKDYRLLAAAVALFLLLAGASSLTKRPWMDEAWMSSPGIDLAEHGKTGVPILDPTDQTVTLGAVMKGVQQRSYGWMPATALVQAPWFRVFGVSVVSDRAFEAAWGLIGLLCWFYVVWTLSGHLDIALLTAALISLDSAFVDAASDGRSDMFTASLGALAMALYLRFRERRLWLAVLLSHACVALAFFAHPVGGACLFAVLLLYFVLDARRFHWTHIPIALAPYALGVGASALYIMQSPDDFRAQMAAVMHAREKSRGNLFSGFSNEVRQRLFGYYFPAFASAKVKILVLLTYTAGLIGSLWSIRANRTPGQRILAALPILYLVLLSVFEPAKQLYYMVYLTPGFAIALAVCVCRVDSLGRLPRWILPVGLAGFAFVQLSWTGTNVVRDTYHKDFLPAATYLREHSKPGSLTMGSGEFAFALGFDGAFLIDTTLGYSSHKQPDFVVVDERGFGETFRSYQKRAPAIYAFVTNLLANDYHQVFGNKTYKIYARSDRVQP